MLFGESRNDRTFDLAVYVQRCNVFAAVTAIRDQKFTCRRLRISDLRRHEREPFLESGTVQQTLVHLTAPVKSAGYQPDILELRDKDARLCVHAVHQSLSDTRCRLLRMDRKKKAAAEFG